MWELHDSKVTQTDHAVLKDKELVDVTRFDPVAAFQKKGLLLRTWVGTTDTQLPDYYPVWTLEADLTEDFDALKKYGIPMTESKRKIPGFP